jgi:hypothetical protein
MTNPAIDELTPYWRNQLQALPLSPEDLQSWVTSPVPALGGLCIVDAIKEGRHQQVRAVIQRMQEHLDAIGCRSLSEGEK